jgi:hypothetical protein
MISDKFLEISTDDEIFADLRKRLILTTCPLTGSTGQLNQYDINILINHIMSGKIYEDELYIDKFKTSKVVEQAKQLTDYLRKMLKSKGFSHFSHGIYGGEATNIKAGVRLNWSYILHNDKDQKEEGEPYNVWYTLNPRMLIKVRRTRMQIKHGENKKIEYNETYYDLYKATEDSNTKSNNFDCVRLDFNMPSDELFRQVLDEASKAVGDPAITKATLIKKIFHNIIAASIVDKLKIRLQDGKLVSSLSDSTVNIQIDPAKSESDACKISVKLTGFGPDKYGECADFLQFFIDKNSLGYTGLRSASYVYLQEIDIGDPKFDPDRVVDAFFQTTLKFYEANKNRVGIESDIDALVARLNKNSMDYQQEIVKLMDGIVSATQ